MPNPLEDWKNKHLRNICREVRDAGLKFRALDIEKIIRLTSFKVRSKKHPELCPYYLKKTPCHNTDNKNFSCLLCACPHYESDKDCGGCDVKSVAGKYIPNYPYSESKTVWDCSECSIGHNSYAAKRFLQRNLSQLQKISETL